MSSETSTKGKKKGTPRPAPETEAREERVAGFQPWHLFFIGTLLASSAAAIAARGTSPANVVFVCLTVIAAGAASFAVYRTLWPLVEPGSVDAPEMLGGRTRAALEREKTLVLRAIKELEFDRAMGKVSEPDFQEMTARLRGRAVRLIRQLDSGSAAYRELIEKELAARQASSGVGAERRQKDAGTEAGATRTEAGATRTEAGATRTEAGAVASEAGATRNAAVVKTLAVVAVVGSLSLATPALAQMGGMGGGMAGMPDPKAMSGIPRPDGSVPVGSFSVRLIRGTFANPIAGHAVEFFAGGKTETVKTDDAGRAVAKDLGPGTLVRAAATVDGERLESQDFAMPDASGVLMLLVASDKGSAEKMAKEAVEGTVTVAGQSRIVTQFEEEVLQVYYLFDLVNATDKPVKTKEPIVLQLPKGARNASVLEGSAPNAVAKGASFVVTGPFAPGVTSLQLAYSLPPAARVSIRQPFPVAVEQVALMAEKIGGMVVASPQLINLREANEGGKTFLLGTGPGLKAGSELAVDITGLPHQSPWPRNAALALAVLILAGGAWAATRTGGRTAAAAVRQQLERRREQVFADIARLEQQRKNGKIDEEEFAEKRVAQIAELERIYGELDTDAQGPRGDQGLAA